MYPAVRILLGLSGIALAGAAIFEVTVAITAERALAADTLPAVEAASHVAPDNAELFGWLAQYDPNRKDALATALRLNPHEPSWWIMRSIDEERAGDLKAAEASLKRSVATANYFVPNWSLAAFYYRHGNVPAFMSSAYAAMATRGDDPWGIFRMAANLKIAPEVIDTQIIPDSAEVISHWLDFASENGDWPGAERAAVRLLALAPKDYADRVLGLCDQLLALGRVDEAITIWNRLSRARSIEMPSIDPAVTNFVDGKFSLPRLNLGFDWRLIAPTNVAFSYPASGGIRLEFDGNEPEECDLMSQYVPVAPGESYRLTTSYRTKGLPAASGVRWSVMEDKLPTGISPNLSSEDAAKQVFEFHTQPEAKLARMVLHYKREPGTVRITGQLSMESVQLERVQQGAKP